MKERIDYTDQMNNLIYIKHLPEEWNIDFIKENICKIVKSKEGRIYNINQDIIFPKGIEGKEHNG